MLIAPRDCACGLALTNRPVPFDDKFQSIEACTCIGLPNTSAYFDCIDLVLMAISDEYFSALAAHAQCFLSYCIQLDGPRRYLSIAGVSPAGQTDCRALRTDMQH